MDVLAALAALSQETRLDIFRFLVEIGREGAPAGQIGARFDLPWATLSFHLSRMKQAGLLTCRRDGRSLIYAADLARMTKLTGFLTDNCCGGRPELCRPGNPRAGRKVARRSRGEPGAAAT